jgi:hypothetical protein
MDSDQLDASAPLVSQAAYRLEIVGEAPGEVAAWLVGVEGLRPIPAIKVLREAGLPLAVAKQAVDASLTQAEQASNRALREAAVDLLSGEADSSR